MEFPIPALVLAQPIYYMDALSSRGLDFSHRRLLLHRASEKAFGLANLLMAPVGEAYFPPLDRCFSGEYQLLFVDSVLWL